MTAQIAEVLLHNEARYRLCTEPLNRYLELAGKPHLFAETASGTVSSCWRGYRGTWELNEDRLYLVELVDAFGSPISFEILFPGYPDRVFAHWYSGQLHCTDGEMLQYEHMGYGSVFERDIYFDVERGAVTGVKIKGNTAETSVS